MLPTDICPYLSLLMVVEYEIAVCTAGSTIYVQMYEMPQFCGCGVFHCRMSQHAGYMLL